MESYLLSKNPIPNYTLAHKRANQLSLQFYKSIGDGTVNGWKVYYQGTLHSHVKNGKKIK